MLTAALAIGSCKSSIDDDFENYFSINGHKFAVVTATYKQNTGVELTLQGSSTGMKVFVSSNLLGKKLDLSTFESTDDSYWVVTTADGKADSREVRSDRGTLYLNYSGSVCNLSVDCVLGHGYSIEAEYTGSPDKKDNSGSIVLDE